MENKCDYFVVWLSMRLGLYQTLFECMYQHGYMYTFDYEKGIQSITNIQNIAGQIN